jgi:two-component system sensor histidine kinase YesM
MNITIRSKIIWSYFLIALIPFFIFVCITAYLFLRQEENNVSDYTDQLLNQVKTSIDVYINTIEKTSNYIMNEVDGSEFFYQIQEDTSWESEKTRITTLLRNIADTHPEVAGILIATENDLYVSTGMTRISKDSFTEEGWYKRAREHPEDIQIISNITGRNIITNERYNVDDVFSLTKAIVDPLTNEVIGVILLDIKHDIISQSIESITLGERGFVFVIDNNNTVVYTPTNKITYRVNPAWLQMEGIEAITTRINDEKYQIRQEYSTYTGWKIVGVFSLDELMGPIYNILYILISCLAVSLICIITFSLKISQSITKPIIQLKRLMKRAEVGDLSVRFEVKYQDEVSELGGNFNQMINRIEELIAMVYKEQQNKQKAELKVLQEQIKPHFLYNTLDTINWMAREYEADDIVKVVDALTSMYRIGLSNGKDYITLEEEIRYVSNYLYIQKIRYRTKLNYEIEEDVSLHPYEVPKLILQPLIENAIYHGIKTKRGDGHLFIRTRELEGNYMELSVEDDGSGMTEEQVEELNRRLTEPFRGDENQSFGLFYINERLRIRYGYRYHVTIRSTKDVGTVITLQIPKEI